MSEVAVSSEESPPPFAVVNPLPDFLSPVFVKELRQGLRARRFVLPFVAAQVLAVIAVGTELGVTSAADVSGELTLLLGGFVYFVVWLVIGVIMPLTNIGALRPELSGGRNVELLLMSNLDRWQIVRGKWMVGMALSALMLISLVPYLLTRYFVGGIDLISIIEMSMQVFLLNGVVTGLAIGASGFGNIIGRVMVLGIGVLSFTGTIFAASWMIYESMSSTGAMTGSDRLWLMFLAMVLALLVSALYAVFGMQLARSRLRLFENPLDPPASGLVIALMIFTPIVVAVTSMATQGYGGWVAAVGLLILALLIDRGPGKETAVRYAQP